MTVTIPGTYDNENLTVGEGVASGQLITPSGLQTLAHNHNFIGAQYRPQVGTVCRFLGFSPNNTGSIFNNVVMIGVSAENTGRGLRFFGRVQNSSLSSAEMRLVCGSNTGSVVTLAGGYNGTVALECDTTASSNFVASVQAKSSGGLLLISGTFMWNEDGYTGTISDAPDGKGFVWAQQNEFNDTFPLTVEQANRFLGGPLTVFNGTPQSIGTIASDLADHVMSLTSAISYEEVGRIVLLKRRNVVKVKMYSLAKNVRIKAEFPDGVSLIQEATGSTSTAPTATNHPNNIIVNVSATQDLMGYSDLIPVVIYAQLIDTSIPGTIASINFILDKS